VFEVHPHLSKGPTFVNKLFMSSSSS
jgi:hypothetical protein